MALAPLPPWLNVNPQQYVEAAKAGSAIGVQIAENRNRAQIAAANLAERAMEQEARRWEFEENLRQKAQELAADRERSAAQLAAAERYNLGRLENTAARNAAQTAHWKALEQAGGSPVYRTLKDGRVIQILPGGQVKDIVPASESPATLTPEEALRMTSNPITSFGLRQQIGDKAFEELSAYGKRAIPGYQPPPSAAAPEVPAAPARTPTIPAQKRSLFGIDMLAKDIPETPLTEEKAREFWNQAGGNRAKAEELAKAAGYVF